MKEQENHHPERDHSFSDENIIAGRNAVHEAIRAGQVIDCIYVTRGEKIGSIGPILAKCREKGILIKEVSPVKLDSLCGGVRHQGIVAQVAAAEYKSVADILRLAEQRGQDPFLIAADEIEDPHNLGAIIRTAEAAGAHGILIPKRRSASLTATVSRSAAGALSHLPVARVGNLAAEIESLKKQGIFIYGADMAGSPYDKTDFSGGVCLVIGSEGKGMGRLIREKCDFIVSLPMYGRMESLNASVAAGILLYEVARQRAAGK